MELSRFSEHRIYHTDAAKHNRYLSPFNPYQYLLHGAFRRYAHLMVAIRHQGYSSNYEEDFFNVHVVCGTDPGYCNRNLINDTSFDCNLVLDPVCRCKPFDSVKLPQVVGYKCCAATSGVCGNQHIHSTDKSSHLFQ